MSFPMPYKRMQFRNIGEYYATQQSAADAAQTITSSESPKNVFRLIFQCFVSFVLSGGSVAAFTLDLRNKDLSKPDRNFLIGRVTLTANQSFNPPMGDANVTTDEFQGYPIPWFPNNYLRLYASTAGAGETTTLTIRVKYLEWEIMKE